MTDEKAKIVQVIRPTKEFAGEAGIKRFAAYCRVSTDSDDQINSFLTQVRYYTEVRSVRFLHEPIRKRLLSLRLSRTEAAPACMSAVMRRSGSRPSETANRFPSATELRM